MGTQKTRRQKIDWFRQYFKQFFEKYPNDSIIKKKLIAQFAIEHASTKRTGEEILNLFEEAGEIEVNDGKIKKEVQNDS